MVGLNNCDREAVHIPGTIQPYGALLNFDPISQKLANISANSERLIGLKAKDLLGRTFTDLFDVVEGHVLDISRLNNGDRIGTFEAYFRDDKLNRRLLCEIHKYKDNVILEIELKSAGEPTFYKFSQKAGLALTTVRSAKNLEQLSAALVDQVRTLTNFDRVVLYKFDADWNGHVIAESRVPTADSYYDLWFPASDIPSQVRALFCIKRMRLIPNVDYEPVPMIPDAKGADGQPIDMSLCNLRNVSPIHVEYLKNMRVKASMSISILKDGDLWGLVSCSKEKEDLHIGSEIRSTAEFLADTFSALLPVHDTENDFVQRAKLMDFHGSLLEEMTSNENFVDGLTADKNSLLGVANACGAAISIDNVWRTVGRCPEPANLRLILESLKEKITDGIYISENLSGEIPGYEGGENAIAGIAIFTTSQAQTNYFCWFKPAVVQTVKWGGDPNKQPQVEGGKLVLHPRKSFEIWKEIVKGKSLPWSVEERRALNKLRHSIIEIVLQKIERITKLNTELERSNNELDSFAYAASHDMKEPLRGIHNYAAMVLRDSAGQLPPQSQSRLETILRLTQRSEDLINSLLHYSQIGRADIILEPVDLNEVVSNALESIRNLIDSSAVTFSISQLPAILGDRIQIMEVFTNLIGNAIKYNQSPTKTISIRWSEPIHGKEFIKIEIEDNGIGIDTKHHDSVFKIFKRLHGKNDFGGGSGTGLTIVKKVIERHGGAISIRSAKEGGTIFTFTLRKAQEKA